MISSARRRLHVYGAVQGVGFRPFVYRLATELGLTGSVCNSSAGVIAEVEGAVDALDLFEQRMRSDRPAQALITAIESSSLPVIGGDSFTIKESERQSAASALILPDLATCDECCAEVFDPANRRYRYPFTNCVQCGPRFSIIEQLPYDRAHTTMRLFTMCAACAAEYNTPDNRRFHAQPNACPDCGPRLTLCDSRGVQLNDSDAAVRQVVQLLQTGAIVAVKGLGGFHLMANARDPVAIEKLRARKARGNKPFAIMYPSLDEVKADCRVSEEESRLLRSAAAPIVLLHRTPACQLPAAVAPGNPMLGIMLPYTPLHHLLLLGLGGPLIATSGNLSEEPICIDNAEALEELSDLADAFLLHDRSIRRPVDDSIVRVGVGREMILRRSRGYAPMPIQLSEAFDDTTLAMGADQKSAIALLHGDLVFLSQHLGDLGTDKSLIAHERMTVDLPSFYAPRINRVACDMHPGYFSARQARTVESIADCGEPATVQHHHAHIVACMTEHGVTAEEVLGVAWDGTGYGTDGTIWGGEFMIVDRHGFKRTHWLRPFPLPGGEKAVRDPRFTALGLLYEAGEWNRGLAAATKLRASLSDRETETVQSILRRNFNCPRTSSAGRLFDGISALLGLCFANTFESEAATRIEFAADRGFSKNHYPFSLSEDGSIDWRPIVDGILADIERNESVTNIAAQFHTSLTELIVEVARWAERSQVVLSGGCFQNGRLLEETVKHLRQNGFEPVWPQRIPPNDGGVALGQAVIVARQSIAKLLSNS